MTTKLCWDVKSNGKYCKNYKLKNKDRCHTHYEHVSDYISLRFLFILTLMLSSCIFYVENSDLVDEKLSITFETSREYLLQLYKNDNTSFHVYLKTLAILLSNFRIYIIKMLN